MIKRGEQRENLKRGLVCTPEVDACLSFFLSSFFPVFDDLKKSNMHLTSGHMRIPGVIYIFGGGPLSLSLSL